jgi:hypothetical protein
MGNKKMDCYSRKHRIDIMEVGNEGFIIIKAKIKKRNLDSN